MSSEPVIDFWFFIGSTYTYLSVLRLDAIAREHGVRFNWRPFNARAIMIEQNNIPFRGKPVKSAYMWRDIERRAGLYGLPVRVPAPYPLQNADLANQVAILAATEGWCEAFTQAAYRRWFQAGGEPGMESHLSATLREVGQDPARVIAQANATDTVQLLRTATEEARAMGIFGSPTFVVKQELFWGDDRLDDALAWLKRGTLSSART